MSSGSKTTTQTANAEPWSAAQPYMQGVLDDASGLYSTGDAFQPYTGSTVVPYSEQTMAGLGAIENQAQQALAGSTPMNQAYNFYGGMFGNSGLSPYQQGVADQWQTTASGSELNNTSPAFDQVLQRIQDDTRTGVDLSMSGAGRYGSGYHTDALGRALGGVTSQALQNEYGRQLGRMDAARSGLASMGQQGIANQFGAAQQLPAAWAAQQLPAQDLMKAGSMYEDLAARTLADQLRIWGETQNAPKQAIEWLNAIASGAGSLGGTNTAQTTEPAPNPFVQIAGGVLGANSLLGNPLGPALFPTLVASDARLKTDIQRIGTTVHDLPLYRFAYRDNPGERFKGVMAQDVLEVMPEAVMRGDDGYYRVNYGMLGIEMERVQ